MRIWSINRILVVLGGFWIAAVFYGWFNMSQYAFSPGRPNNSPTRWPEQSTVDRVDNTQTLLVFVHPQCPCTQATVAELERILVTTPEHTKFIAFAYTPHEAFSAWLDTPSIHGLQRIPGMTIVEDKDGIEAHRFAVNTSGEILLYDSKGALRFQGGVTGSRGHEGDNEGKRALHLRLTHTDLPFVHIPTFGCALASNAENSNKE